MGQNNIHCSAGIHRTVMTTYGLLRYIGLASEETENFLKELLVATIEDFGQDRLSWGDQFG